MEILDTDWDEFFGILMFVSVGLSRMPKSEAHDILLAQSRLAGERATACLLHIASLALEES